jgi:hypothetical protein
MKIYNSIINRSATQDDDARRLPSAKNKSASFDGF